MNWGCGSSREQAVTCLLEAGVRVIIAASFSRIYYRNAINNGLLPIICSEAVAAIQPGEEVTVDVEANRIHCPAGSFSFIPLSSALRDILDAGGLIPMVQAQMVRANWPRKSNHARQKHAPGLLHRP